MSKVQTRRTVSLSGPTYAQLRRYASNRGESMSSVLERLLAPVLALPEPTVAADVTRVQDVRW